MRVNHQDQDQARGKAAPERAVHTSRANQWVPSQGPAAASFHSAHLLPRPRISPATKQNITSLTFPLTRSPLDDPGVSVLTTAGCYMGPLTHDEGGNAVEGRKEGGFVPTEQGKGWDCGRRRRARERLPNQSVWQNISRECKLRPA